MKTKLYIAICFVFAFSLAAAGCKDTKSETGDTDVIDEIENADGDMDEDADEEDEWNNERECAIAEVCIPSCHGKSALTCEEIQIGGCSYAKEVFVDCSPGICVMEEPYHPFCSGGDMDDKNESETSSVKLTNVSNSECLNGYGKSETPQESFSAVYDPEKKRVMAAHNNAIYNCCIIRIDVSMTMEGNTISLFETEVVEEPCKCDCPYNVQSLIEGLSPAVYVVKFYQEGEYKGEAEVTVQ